MKAGVFQGAHDVVVLDVAEPEPEPEGIVIGVRACGICGSDLHVFDEGQFVRPGQIMGHEFAGDVLAVGAGVDGIAVGDRVAAMPLIPCDACPSCLRGDVQQCVQAFAPGLGFGLPGAFAERLHVPAARLGRTVFRLDHGVSYDDGALAEPLAVAVHAVRRSGARAGDRAVVLGLGPIGHLIARVLRAEGVEDVVGVERRPARRAQAQAAGIPAVEDAAGAGPVDVVFECTGVPALAQAAARLVRRGGTVVIVAIYGGAAPVDVSGLGVTELTVRGSSAYDCTDFADAVALLARGVVRAADIVERTTLAGLPGALAAQLAGSDALKVVIDPR